MRKILFIVNPISGGLDKRNFRNTITGWCDSNKIEFTFFDTTGENDLQKINSQLSDFLPSTVVACGGDGTVNLVAQSILKKHNINLGIIPLGSANGLATELGIPEDEKEALKIVLSEKIKAVDVLKINGEHLCLHLSDIGLNAKLIKRFERGSTRGKLGYARHFFETLFNKKALEYSFKSEEEDFNEKAEMVVFANAKKYGTGAVVNPLGKLGDRKFEVCIFKPYPWYAIFRLTYLFFTGKLNYSPFVKIFSTSKVEVNSNKAEHLQIDGEPIGKFKQVSVEVSPDQLSILVK